MITQALKNIISSRVDILEKEGIVILPLKKWKDIERGLEDLEMRCSGALAEEISERRKEKKIIPLRDLLKKYRI